MMLCTVNSPSEAITVSFEKRKVKQANHLGVYPWYVSQVNKCEQMCYLLTGVELMTTLHRLCATDSIVTAFLSLTEPSDGTPVVLYCVLLTYCVKVRQKVYNAKM